MKSVEERLKTLPEMAESTGLQADEALKRKILRAAQQKKAPKRLSWRLAPALCAFALVIVLAAAVPGLLQDQQSTPLINSQPAGGLNVPGDKLALDLPRSSISIRSAANPAYRSIWAPATGGNFPLIGVKGRYYRLLTNPTALPASMLGEKLGTVDQFTNEPALAGRNGICSNVVAQGEAVYAVSGMKGALAAAKVNGQTRLFQRVSFGDNALVGGESLADTLRAGSVTALELSGVGTINDAATAKRLMSVLTRNASFLRSAGGETNQSLLIQLENGLVLQLAVSGERLLGCGSWACPEFFDAFQEALQ